MSRNIIRRARDASQQYRLAEKRLADASVLQDAFVARSEYLRAMSAFQN
jgi:hypothetical protein